MQLNYLAILVASVLQFVVGAVWYSALFGKLWGKIHGFDKLPKATQQAMMKEMGPYYGVQFVVTIVTTFVLALFISVLPTDWNAYGIAGFMWIGFMVPATISSVIFGGTEGKWIIKKIAIQIGASFACLMVAAAVIHMMK